MDTIHRIKLSRAQIRYLNSEGIYQFRIILKIKFTNSVERYISMAFVKLHDYSAVEAYMDEIQGHIVDKDSYLSQVDPEIYDSVMEILIDWRD